MWVPAACGSHGRGSGACGDDRLDACGNVLGPVRWRGFACAHPPRHAVMGVGRTRRAAAACHGCCAVGLRPPPHRASEVSCRHPIPIINVGSVAVRPCWLRAQQHRASLSRAESLLWSALCRGQLGVRFRRQVVVGEFIVDFLAPSVRVIVELDGDEHRLKRSADAARDRKLGRLGYRVVRVLNRDVERDLGGVVGVIRAAVRGG